MPDTLKSFAVLLPVLTEVADPPPSPHDFSQGFAALGCLATEMLIRLQTDRASQSQKGCKVWP